LERRYQLRWTKTAIKEFELLNGDKLKAKATEILNILENNPFQNPPPYEKLRGELDGLYSRRLNTRHRIVYEVVQSDDPNIKGIVIIVRMRTHYRGMISLMI
jgi:Txe/YoeB family toxin of toxin-antitoxin system